MILLPRPAPHLPRTLAAFKEAGLTNLLPLALSKPVSLPVTLSANITSLILTSRFGIPEVPPAFKALPTYCVGGCTAKAAKDLGFNVTYTGTNNGVSMARDIFELHLKRTHFAHLHGDHAGTDWHAILQLAGHTVTPVLAYKTQRLTALPTSIIQSLLSSAPPILIPLFSAGSASHLANLLKHANMQPTGTAVAFSPAVARAAQAHWSHVVTAPAPTLQAMASTLRHLQG